MQHQNHPMYSQNPQHVPHTMQAQSMMMGSSPVNVSQPTVNVMSYNPSIHSPSPQYMQQPSPQTMPPTAQQTTAVPAPKRKRVQVPAACMQCKKAHAACSYTRPCDRCVRVNQASACVSSPFPSTNVHSLTGVETMLELPPPDVTTIASAPTASILFPTESMNAPTINENELSRFLFEDNTEFHSSTDDFPIYESVSTPSPQCVQSTCGSTPSPPLSSSSSSVPSTPPVATPPPPPPAQQPASFGPSAAQSIASSIGAAHHQNFPVDILQNAISLNPMPMETMMQEMLQQNKRMEDLVTSMKTEMQNLRQEVVNLKTGPQQVAKLDKSSTANTPGTAVWTVHDGALLEYNERFCNIVELKEIPQGYRMNHFFGGPCSNAAKARMNQHLANLNNAQPATDYAVVERKKISGEVMRLMIVVNVIPAPVPVFLTVMWELA